MRPIALRATNSKLNKFLDSITWRNRTTSIAGNYLTLRNCSNLTVTITLIFLCNFVAIDYVRSEEGDSSSFELLTLEDALSMAFDENLRINNAELEVEKAGDAISAARTRLLPVLDFSVYEAYHLTDEPYTFNKGAFGDFPTIGPVPAKDTQIATAPNFTTFLTFSVKQPISQIYEILLFIKQRKVEKDIFIENLRSKRQEIADKVKTLYYDILKSESKLKAIDEKILFLAELLELVNRYVQQQRALESESLDVKARLGHAEYEAFSEKNTLATQKERLNELIGRDIETPFIVDPITKIYPYKVNSRQAQEEALSQRPEVKAAKLTLQFAKNEVKLKKAKYIPEIGILFNYGANFDIRLLPENIATVGVIAKWDIFDWGRKQSDIAEKRKSVLQAQNLIRESKSQVRIQVNENIRKLEEAEALINVTKLEQDAHRERLRIVMNKYRQQSALLQEVLEAQSTLEDANNRHEQAILDYWTARANLEKALGET